jgi:hypothetical protein
MIRLAMGKNTFFHLFSVAAACVLISACQRQQPTPTMVASAAQDPLALESKVSIISDGPMLMFDAGTSGDKALREFEAATGCQIGLSKLAIEIGDIQKFDLLIANRNVINDLSQRKQLTALQIERLASVSSIDKKYQSNNPHALALQWSPMGVLNRPGTNQSKVPPIVDQSSVIMNAEQLKNPELTSALISLRYWRDIVATQPEVSAQWAFSMVPDGTPEIYQMAMAKQAQHPNCAYALMQYLLTPRLQAELAKEWNTVPVVSAACYGNDVLGEQGCQLNSHEGLR